MAQGYAEQWVNPERAGQLECLICHCVARDAVATQCCGQFLCLGCWEQCQGRSTTCPHCRQAPASADPANRDRREIQNLEIRCPNGCGATIALLAKERHMESGCTHRRVRCTDCGDDVVQKDLKNHRELHCAVLFEPCQVCGEKVRVGSMQAHMEARMTAEFQGTVATLAQEVSEQKAHVAQLTQELQGLKREFATSGSKDAAELKQELRDLKRDFRTSGSKDAAELKQELQLLKQGQAKLQAHLDSITGNYSASTVDTSRGDSFRPRYVRTATNCDLFPRVHLF
ncbi:unnamed protein product [Symbiodinium natans]|uniref:Uncharacterized protein n=1 Tax=Symbiodinium natans TaxID=878477 RepID=A0A812JRD7_9DINO|nr:unnamed protein product [Symbiodinium natans]